MIGEVYPPCKDTRRCFGRKGGKCTILNHNYSGESCPFCKPERDKLSPYLDPIMVPESFGKE